VLPSDLSDRRADGDPAASLRGVSVAVTGGAGFIGHHLVRHLVATGSEVTAVDNLSTGFRERLADIPGVRFIDVDIRDGERLASIMSGVDTIFHLAALPSVQRSLKDPLETHAINVTGTLNVMLAAAVSGVRRVVFAGSSSVYGLAPGLPRKESQKPDPQSPYAVSKLAAEGYVNTLGVAHGVETVVLRYFNVFGPGQDPTSLYAAVVPRFVTAVLAGRQPTVFGDGHQTRDFTYVENVTHANVLAATAPASGGVFNIGCGSRYSLLDLLAAVGRSVGTQVEPVFAPPNPGDVRDSQADVTLAMDALGYSPLVGFEEGVDRTVAYYATQEAT
jgi:UDP-glucose 4-epimerase